MTLTIYHNPDCGTSRNTLAILRNARLEPDVIEYLKTPPDRETLSRLLEKAGLTIRQALRKKGTPYNELSLDDRSLTDDQLFAAVEAHPILLNRPLVVTDSGVALCRPSEAVLDLLGELEAPDLRKEDGSPVLRDRRLDAASIASTLATEGLPTQDLGEPKQAFYGFHTLSGASVGVAGIQFTDNGALLRSIVVHPELRGKGFGRAIVSLLMFRAQQGGARSLFTITSESTGFFEAQGFSRVERSALPSAIAGTPQVSSLCPASATVLTRGVPSA